VPGLDELSQAEHSALAAEADRTWLESLASAIAASTSLYGGTTLTRPTISSREISASANLLLAGVVRD